MLVGLESEDTTINGMEYRVTKLPSKVGRKLLIKFYKVFGPVLGKALSNSPDLGGVEIGDIKIETLGGSLGAAVEALADTLSESDFDMMTDIFAVHTQICKDSKWVPLKSVMEFHFSGNYVEMFQWLGFAIKVNFLGFTAGQVGLFENLLARAKEIQGASRSPNTSTGESTESPPPQSTPAD